jgi:hypothetical protein
MNNERWNRQHPIGTRVRLNLPSGESWQTRTVGPALRRDGLDYVAIAGLGTLVLLSSIDVLDDVLPWSPSPAAAGEAPAVQARIADAPAAAAAAMATAVG